jgi:hypothetical protein
MASRNHPKRASKDMRQLDQSVVEIVNGINGLLINARVNNLGAISSILEDARESIAWWAIHDDYNESHCDKLAHEFQQRGMHSAAAYGQVYRHQR